jgi:hypothetical protein
VRLGATSLLQIPALPSGTKLQTCFLAGFVVPTPEIVFRAMLLSRDLVYFSDWLRRDPIRASENTVNMPGNKNGKRVKNHDPVLVKENVMMSRNGECNSRVYLTT